MAGSARASDDMQLVTPGPALQLPQKLADAASQGQQKLIVRTNTPLASLFLHDSSFSSYAPLVV